MDWIRARVWFWVGLKAKKEVQRRDVSVQFMGVVDSECTETIWKTKKNKETERVAKRDDGTGVMGGKRRRNWGRSVWFWGGEASVWPLPLSLSLSLSLGKRDSTRERLKGRWDWEVRTDQLSTQHGVSWIFGVDFFYFTNLPFEI